MQKLFQLILINFILPTSPRLYFGKERFTGCESSFFPNSSLFTFLKIDFSVACFNLEVCAEDPSTTQALCLEALSSEMKNYCSSYTNVNLWRRRYCFKIAEKNQEIAEKLKPELFKVCEIERATGLVNMNFHNNSSKLKCLDYSDPNDVKVVTCDDTDSQNWSRFFNVDTKYLTMEDSNGNCLNGESVDNKMNLIPCNYCNDNLYFKLEPSSGQNFYKNKGTEKYIDLPAGNIDSEVGVIVFYTAL